MVRFDDRPFFAEFRLSDYISLELLPSSERKVINELRRNDMLLSGYADRLISENDSFAGWFYKGVCTIMNGSVSGCLTCWSRSVLLCDDRTRLNLMYGYMISILVRYKIHNDVEQSFQFAYLRYSPMRMLDVLLSESEYIDHERYDIYRDIIELAESIAEHDLLPGEQHSLTDVLANVYTDALRSYGDFHLLLDIMRKITVIEKRSLLRTIFRMDIGSHDRCYIDPDSCSLIDLLKTIDPSLKECPKNDCRALFGSVAEMMFHHHIKERLEYQSARYTNERLSELKTILRDCNYFGFIDAYDHAYGIFEDCDDYCKYAPILKGNALRDSAYASVDMMVSILPQDVPQERPKKRHFWRR